MCVFCVVDFCLFWTYVDPGKFMVCFLCAYFCVVILGTLFCHLEIMDLGCRDFVISGCQIWRYRMS